ncbi:hypothetical protein SEVIR_6G217900v4 [Setaria viridis]|uniref:Uncharacterized protein n=1 Tax=Setaria viridis TaxID=4556 RepID=A0A4U6U7V4_SETVI|nr:hypothetical protein SEVIR_6G217900v2 [Setaria viridis]
MGVEDGRGATGWRTPRQRCERRRRLRLNVVDLTDGVMELPPQLVEELGVGLHEVPEGLDLRFALLFIQVQHRNATLIPIRVGEDINPDTSGLNSDRQPRFQISEDDGGEKRKGRWTGEGEDVRCGQDCAQKTVSLSTLLLFRTILM